MQNRTLYYLPRDIAFRIVIFAASTGMFFVYLNAFRNETLIAKDSLSYINFSPDRPIGYPIFLSIIGLFDKSYALAFPVQLALLCGSSALLAIAIASFLDSYVAGTLLLGMLLANKVMLRLSASIMSDPLACILLTLFTAFSISYVRSARLQNACIKTFFVGWSIACRPINIVFPLSDLLIVLLGNTKIRTRLKHAVIALAFALISLMITPLFHLFYSASVATSPLARGLFQKAIFDAPVDKSAYARCVDEATFSAIEASKDYIARAPESFRPVLVAKMSDYVRFQIVIPALNRAGRPVDQSLMCFAMDAMKKYGFTILRDDLADYIRLATYSPRINSNDAVSYINYITQNSPSAYLKNHSGSELPYFEASSLQDDFYPEPEFGGATRTAARLLIGLSNLVPLIAVIVVLFVRRPDVRFLLLISVAFGLPANIALAATAMIEFPLSRYVMVYLPLLLTALICAAWAAFSCLPKAIRPHPFKIPTQRTSSN